MNLWNGMKQLKILSNNAHNKLIDIKKVGDHGWSEGFHFISYNTKAYRRALSLFPDWSALPLICTLWIVGQTGFFSLGKATSPGEGQLWIKTC